MINSINSGMAIPMSGISASPKSLTEEQLAVMSDTLSEMDVDNLSEADALTIVEHFSEAGIPPGKAMEAAMSDLGFDAKQIGELAGVEKSVGGHPPPPPPSETQSTQEIGDIVSFLEELLEESEEGLSSEIADQQKEAIYAKVLDQFGLNDGDSIINTTA